MKEYQWVGIETLKPNPKNPNKHSAEQIERLIELIKYQGWRHPIIVSNQSGLVVVGHGRIEAAKKMGLDKVPVEYQDFASEDQEYAFLVSDNAIASWAELDLPQIIIDLPKTDFDIDLLGIKDFAMPKEALTDEDSVPEINQSEARTKRGELYQLGNHRLLCGDATDSGDVEKLMNGEKADMVFTDPPYGDCSILDKDGKYIYRNDNDGRKNQVYSRYQGQGSFSFPNINEIISTVADKQVVWGGNALPLPISRSWIVWDKTVSEDGGNWFSDCELAWCNLDTPIFKIRHVFQGAHKEGEKEERVHPTQKPVAMIEKVFNRIEEKKGNRKFKTDFIADIFLGSGSTLIACEKTNRKCYGMEIDPHYCDVIVERWEKLTGRKAELIT